MWGGSRGGPSRERAATSIAALVSTRPTARGPAPIHPRGRSGRRRPRPITPARASAAEPSSASVPEPAVPGVYATSEENDAHFKSQRSELERLAPLREALLRCDGDLKMKTEVVDADPTVRAFVASNGPVARVLSNIGSEDSYLLKSPSPPGQVHVLENVSTQDPMTIANVIRPLVQTLRNVETFYDMLGGVVGYQFAALELIHEQFGRPGPVLHERRGHGRRRGESASRGHGDDRYAPAGGTGPARGRRSLRRARRHVGPRGVAEAGRGVPLGRRGRSTRARRRDDGRVAARGAPVVQRPDFDRGADPRSHRARVAVLQDVWASARHASRGDRRRRPRSNTRRISALMSQKNFFGQGENSFRLFEQPLVPVVTTRGGQWVTEGGDDLSVALKPGATAAIWKLMHDQGVFTWLEAKGRKGATVRQITNPMAGTDTILALAGVGAREDKALGFAGCERHLGASEGVNVLVERSRFEDEGTGGVEYSYGISNVEYTVLEQHGIDDTPVDEEATRARSPPTPTSSTSASARSARACCLPRGRLPSMLVNLSKPAMADGTKGGQLETSMQNIADVLMQRSKGRRCTPRDGATCPAVALYTLRRRITSSAKKKRNPDQSPPNLAQTPDGSFLDLVKNAADLLDRCGVSHPPPQTGTVEDYLANGPGFIFCANPAIGPLWQVTEQKNRARSIGTNVRGAA